MAETRKTNFNKSSGRRILSDVIVPKRTVAAVQMFQSPPPSVRYKEKRVSKIFKRKWKALILVMVLVIGGFILSFVTHRMEIRIIPQTANVVANKTLSLTKKFDESTKLPIRTVAVADTEEGIFDGKIVSSPVEKKAKGIVVIFNKSSISPQVLIATTRLSAPDGKIYRIPKTITVPGYRVENKEIIPGSKEVEVMADKAGAEYNIGLVDFTIPGFAGGPKFKTIFGRSKTPMEGGDIGTENSVAEADLDKAMINLTAKTSARASALLRSKISSDAVLLQSSVESVVVDKMIKFAPEQGQNKFSLTLKSEARGATFDKNNLVRFFPEVVLPKPFRIASIENTAFELIGYQYNNPEGQLKISGTIAFESVVDPREVKKFILDKKASKSTDILSNFVQLSSVETRFKPFWLQYPPSNPGRIDIILPIR